MSVTVEKVSNVKRKLTIVVPQEKIQAAYSYEIDAIAKKANIKGFRPGKAPLSYIQQHYGAKAQQDALSRVIQDTLFSVLQDEKITPISVPRVEPKLVSAGQPLEFVASFEVLPEIERVVFSSKEIEKLAVAVLATDVEIVIEKLLKQYSSWEEANRPAQWQDRIVIDFTSHYEGQKKENEEVKGYPLELGSKTMINGFEEGLIGVSVGDERELKLVFPEDLTDKDRAGKPVTFRVTVKQILSAKQPTLDEAFVKKLGVASGQLDELKEQIKQSLEKESERATKDKLKEQIFAQLLEQNQIEIPEALIESEKTNLHRETCHDHEHHHHSDADMQRLEEVAKKRVSIGLLLSSYATQENIKVDSQRVQARIEEIAAIYEKPEELIAWFAQAENRKDIEAQVLEDQLIDKLIEGATVVEKKMSFSELKGIKI